MFSFHWTHRHLLLLRHFQANLNSALEGEFDILERLSSASKNIGMANNTSVCVFFALQPVLNGFN